MLAHVAGLDELREQRVAEILLRVVLAALVEPVEHRAGGEDEDLVADQVPRRIVGLVGVVAHAPAVGLDDAVAARVVRRDLGGDHRRRRPGLDVLLDEGAVVERVDGVRAEHDERLGRELADHRRGAPQGVRGAGREAAAAVVALARVEDQQPAVGAVEVPGPAVGEVVAERDRVELLGDPDVVQPGVVAVREREVDQPVRAGERHGGLRAVAGEELQPPAGAAREHEDERADAAHAASGVSSIAGSSAVRSSKTATAPSASSSAAPNPPVSTAIVGSLAAFAAPTS